MANCGAYFRTRVAGTASRWKSANGCVSSGLIRVAASIATVAFACATTPVQAGINTWTTNGPYGGLVTVVAIDPQTPANLYAAGISGIFKSSNGGASWARASNGINAPSVDAIAIDPATPTTLYAGSIQGVVAKSVDGAETWTELSGVGAPSLVVALAIDPKTPATIYASTEQGGISKSTDSGATWATVGVATLPGFPTFKSLVIDPVTPSTIYAGDQSNGVYKSVDGGATWDPANTGLTGPALQILNLAIDPQTTSTLYAVANTSGGSGLFKSTDSGGHWALIANGNVATFNFGILAVAVDPQTPSTVYIGAENGTFKSINGGTSFAPMHSGMPTRFIEVIAINPANSATLYAGTEDGLFATINGGALWAAANNGLALTTVTAVAVDPTTPATVYAGTATSGIFKSIDSGHSWTAADTGIPPTGSGCLVPSISTFAIDPSTPTTIYAGTQCTDGSGVLKSINAGATWATSSTGLPFGDVIQLAIDPTATSNIYAALGDSGLYQSADGGATWTANTALPTGSFVFTVSVGLIPGPPSPDAVTKSAHSSSKGGRVSTTAGVLPVIEIGTVDDSDGDTHFIPFISTDGGKSATGVPVDITSCVEHTAVEFVAFFGRAVTQIELLVACLSAIPIGPGAVLINGYTVLVPLPSPVTPAPIVRASRAKVTKRARASTQSTNGTTPTAVSVPWGQPNGSNSDAAVCSPVNATVINPLDAAAASFYGGGACGVIHAINYGQQMVTMNAGLPSGLQIDSMAINPAGDTLYAGAASGGVYQFVLGPQPPTQLAFTNVDYGLSPTAGVAFDVVLHAVAADLSAQSVASNTTVLLSVASGVGALSGTLSCQIPAGSNSCTIASVIYSAVDSNVVLTATRTAGDTLAAANSPPFNTLAPQAPTQLTITKVNGGADPTVATAFDVVVLAMADDLSPQNVVTATSVQISVGSGAGTLGGATTCQIPAGSSSCTVVGVTYSQADTNVVLIATATAGDTLAAGNSVPFNVDSLASPPSLVSAVARKVHGSAGTFDLPLSLVVPPAVNHNPTTEPRQGPAQTIVFTFDKAITGATAAIAEGTATAGTLTFSGSDVVVPLTGVADQQYVTVSLTNVTASDGGSNGSAAVRIGFLFGDVNQNRVVTVADLGLVNAQLAQIVTATNFLKDVNASGTLSVADKGLTNANLTRSLPAP
jgi:photosystem II stability/assembly factor-like uncharacterized protein